MNKIESQIYRRSMFNKKSDIGSKISEVSGYKLETKLGAGNMGEVWQSTHPSFKIPVALKLIDVSIAPDNSELIARFLKEARLASSVTHQNILRVYEAGNEGDICWMALELCIGSVETLMKNTDFTEEEKVEFFKQSLEGLIEAHKHKIVHRDMKPANLLIDRQSHIKIADLGIAKDTDDSFSNTFCYTVANTGMGTPHYIAPEQAMDAKNVDHRADIYSLGATFYHIFTGHRPFQGKSQMQILQQHLTQPLSWDDSDQISPIYKEIITKMMEKKPKNRYQSCQEVLNALKKGSKSEPNTPPPTEKAKEEVFVPQDSKKAPTPVIICMVLAIAIVLFLILKASI